MKYCVLLIIVFFFCSACTNARYQISDREKAVNKQMGHSAKMLSSKYNMQPCATTVAMPSGNIKYLELEFNMRGPLSQDVIRTILINSVHDFLNNINSDQELCSYLRNRHLEISEVGITLFFHDDNRYPLKEPEIGIASIREGELEYFRCDPNDISIKGLKGTTETYEEALQMLQSQN
jgi:hypothetical protein